ncbi:TnpV protein, partial [Ruminococcus sp.]
MEKYKYNESNGLWYELQGNYYLPCLKLPEEEQVHIGIWGQRHLNYLRENKRVLL